MNKKSLSFILGIITAINVSSANIDSIDRYEEVTPCSISDLLDRVKGVVKEYEVNNVKEKYEFGYLKSDSKMYVGSSYITIQKYQKVVIINDNDGYYYVRDENDVNGYVSKESVGIIPGTFVEVDISSQTVNFYIDNELYLSTPCVTGNKGMHTRNGYFSIRYKKYDTYLVGPGYRSHVYYWMPFDNAIGLHDADGWRNSYGGDIYLTNGSHGCINMPEDAAREIYNNVSEGTKVLVHK